jgi:hypothetical protein
LDKAVAANQVSAVVPEAEVKTTSVFKVISIEDGQIYSGQIEQGKSQNIVTAPPIIEKKFVIKKEENQEQNLPAVTPYVPTILQQKFKFISKTQGKEQVKENPLKENQVKDQVKEVPVKETRQPKYKLKISDKSDKAVDKKFVLIPAVSSVNQKPVHKLQNQAPKVVPKVVFYMKKPSEEKAVKADVKKNSPSDVKILAKIPSVKVPDSPATIKSAQ